MRNQYAGAAIGDSGTADRYADGEKLQLMRSSTGTRGTPHTGQQRWGSRLSKRKVPSAKDGDGHGVVWER